MYSSTNRIKIMIGKCFIQIQVVGVSTSLLLPLTEPELKPTVIIIVKYNIFNNFIFFHWQIYPLFDKRGGKKERKRKRKEDHLGCVGVIYTASFRFITCNTGLFRMCFRPRLSRPPSKNPPSLRNNGILPLRREEPDTPL